MFPAALPKLGGMLEIQWNHHRSAHLTVKHLALGFFWVRMALGPGVFPWVGSKKLSTMAVLLWPCCSSCHACFRAFLGSAWLCRNAMYLYCHATAGICGPASPKNCWTLKLAACTWSQCQKLNSLMPLHIAEHHHSSSNDDLVIVQRKKARSDIVQL